MLTIVASHSALIAVLWEHERLGRVRLPPVTEDVAHPILDETHDQLRAYFAGTRTVFDLPLAPQGTPFQREVWAALRTIPSGQTRTYAQIAAQVGRPAAVRAVGAANGRNPISIIVPCHRVVGSDGSLTGFAGGLDAKRLLLDLERSGRPATPAA